MRGKLLASSALFAACFCTPEAAKADPISTAIVTAVGLTGTAAAVASTVLTIGLTTAANFALSSVLAPKKSAGIQERQADVLQLTIGESPRAAVIGEACVGGTLLGAFNYGDNNEWECMVIAVADHWVHSLKGVYVNDKYYAWTEEPTLSNQIPAEDGQPAITIAFRDGRPNQDVDDILRTYGGAYWDSNKDKLSGVAHATVTYRVSQKAWPSGRPSFKWVLKGLRCYDPRKDSTVPGGSGAHRWGDVTTYEFTENAALIAYNYLRGIWSDTAVNRQLLIGPGKTAEEAPPESWIAAANACAEIITNKNGGQSPRYRLSGEIKANEVWGDVLSRLADCMAGDIVPHAGGILIQPGVAQSVDPANEFTDARLIKGETIKVTNELSRDQMINTVAPKYIEPALLYQDHASPLRRSLADLAEDGEPREAPLDLPYVIYQTQAQRCGEILRRKSRRMRQAEITLGPRYLRTQPGDWMGWTSNRYFGGQRVVFRVDSVTRTENLRVKLILREIDDQVFAWDPNADELDPKAGGYLEPAAPAPLTLTGFNAFAFTAEDSIGAPRAAVRVTWDPVTEPLLTGVRAEIRRVGYFATQNTVFPFGALPSAEAGELNASLTFDADYEVRLVPEVRQGREALATAWQPVRTDPYAAPNVTGFTAESEPAGAMLDWSIAARPDVIGYQIRVGPSALTSWEDADIVISRQQGPPFFAAIATQAPVYFQIRALTASGGVSPSSALAIAQVTAPPNVTEFNVYPTGQTVRFTWAEPAENLIYEIRAGADWSTARFVTEGQGGGSIALWPIRNDVDGLFWIKARSAAGLYSPLPYLASARPAPLSDRNVVVEQDFADLDWPGVVHAMTRDGGFLTLNKEGGVTVAAGDYYGAITLPATFLARAWIEQRLNALLGGDPSWEDLGDLTWEQMGERTWDPPLSDAGTARCTPYIAVNVAPDDSIVDAWRFAANDTSIRAAAPTLSVNVERAECWTSLGAHVPLTARLVVPVSAAVEYAAIFAVRYPDALTEETVIATFYGGGDWLQVIADPAAGTVSLLDSNGARIDVDFQIAADDPVKFGIDQTATTRTLYVASRLKPTPVVGSAALAPLAAPDFIELSGAGLGDPVTWADADFDWNDPQALYPWRAQYWPLGDVAHRQPATFENLKVQSIGLTLELFESEIARGAPVGFEPFRPFQPGDYKLSEAIIWLHVEAPDRADVTISLTAATLVVDVPDLLDSDEVDIPAAVTRVLFRRPFNLLPQVTVSQVGGVGASPVHVKVIEDSIDLEGFDVQLGVWSNPATLASGRIAYMAKGG